MLDAGILSIFTLVMLYTYFNGSQEREKEAEIDLILIIIRFILLSVRLFAYISRTINRVKQKNAIKDIELGMKDEG